MGPTVRLGLVYHIGSVVMHLYLHKDRFEKRFLGGPNLGTKKGSWKVKVVGVILITLPTKCWLVYSNMGKALGKASLLILPFEEQWFQYSHLFTFIPLQPEILEASLRDSENKPIPIRLMLYTDALLVQKQEWISIQLDEEDEVFLNMVCGGVVYSSSLSYSFTCQLESWLNSLLTNTPQFPFSIQICQLMCCYFMPWLVAVKNLFSLPSPFSVVQ